MDSKLGSCHCGAVTFEVIFKNGMQNIRRCDCSLCKRKGAIMVSVPLADRTVTNGKDALTLYQWNTKTAKHYFCKECGIYTHHQRRSVPTEFGVNVGCLEGVDPLSLKDVVIGNGAAQ
ncbi:GFA family protein [Gilvimarinus sp. SDUM040013]|uniref:GFA family protein n=1 Tax=Gilvimarinus gilvus TaxID=3058038 RepID=A0ABU4RX76_9GAMM|nr:GFA family protein [Gilvimarinus sp. SDUM040013]MDO3387888.1 GFA family protein [Gilvimarinus sp. SDUM040013]MDX6848741.1 GFA family protein [Gilvimarinus sp. SDUM040013]